MEVLSSSGESSSAKYDRAKELKEFHKSKAGVKGLVDSGLAKIPRMFIHQRNSFSSAATIINNHRPDFPLIDLLDLGRGQRNEVIDRIRRASETWGFFLVLPRLIPDSVMDEVLGCQKQFHEQSTEMKASFYSLDERRSFRFYSNGVFDDSEPAEWRDSLEVSFPDGRIDTNSIPVICRKAIMEYLRSLGRLKETLSELLSEGLGLSNDYLSKKIECFKGGKMVCDYYPTCPQPNLTMGVSSHKDPHFLTIILQDYSGGLQVLYQNQWVNIPPIRGALAVNIGDLLQLISNDRLKSAEYRVVAKPTGPSLTVSCFFDQSSSKSALEPLGPIKELLSVSNPPSYPEIHTTDLKALFRSKGMDGTSALSHFRLNHKGWMLPLAFH